MGYWIALSVQDSKEDSLQQKQSTARDSADVQLAFDQVDYLLAAMTPRTPRRFAPTANHGISLRARGNGKNIGDSDGTALFR